MIFCDVPTVICIVNILERNNQDLNKLTYFKKVYGAPLGDLWGPLRDPFWKGPRLKFQKTIVLKVLESQMKIESNCNSYSNFSFLFLLF